MTDDVSANSYFWPKIGKHDVTLTSFAADLSHADHFPLVNVCHIDVSEGTESFLAILVLLRDILAENERGTKNSPPACRSKTRVKLKLRSQTVTMCKNYKKIKDVRHMLYGLF